MFDRPHHQRIEELLQAFNCELLIDADCYLGGSTAIVLKLNEYRDAVGIDFLCGSHAGYRLLRNTISTDLGQLLKSPIKQRREVKTAQNTILTFLDVANTPIRVEFLREWRVSLAGEVDPTLGVLVLSQIDLYCQKLLANADRGLDRSFMSRDIIDLAMMVALRGDLPKAAWDKAYAAYGDILVRTFHEAAYMITDSLYLTACLRSMGIENGFINPIMNILKRAQVKYPLETLD